METAIAQPTDSFIPEKNGFYSIQLNGMLPPEWVGSMCAGLSARRISVESGFARQVSRGNWQSSFIVRPLDATTDVASVNYRSMALAPKAPLGNRNHPGIRSFHLEQTPDALKVSLRAADKLGLLSGLLSSFSFLTLFAHEMKIETVQDEARDMFVLRGFAGSVPTPDKCERLLAMLQVMAKNGELSP